MLIFLEQQSAEAMRIQEGSQIRPQQYSRMAIRVILIDFNLTGRK